MLLKILIQAKPYILSVQITLNDICLIKWTALQNIL